MWGAGVKCRIDGKEGATGKGGRRGEEMRDKKSLSSRSDDTAHPSL